MKNINQETRRQQNTKFLAILAGLVVLGGGGWLYMDHLNQDNAPAQAAAPAPNMTGVVDENLTGKVQTAAIEEAQKLNKETVKQMKAISNRLDDLGRENAELKEKLTRLGQQGAGDSGAGQTGDDGIPRPNLPVTEGAASDGASAGGTTPGGQDVQTPDMRPDAFGVQQPGMRPGADRVIIRDDRSRGLRRSEFAYPRDEDAEKPRYKFPYIPSGSFSPSVTIEGADANASVTGANDTAPMQLRITGVTRMPNDQTVDLTGCFVTLAAYGDVSSERAEVRTRSLSCIIDGETIDQEIKGHVSFKGKNGIKGEVVMRNGEVLGWAWTAGFVDGLGGGMQQLSQTQVGVGATASPGIGDVLKGGMGGGASKAANTLSEYYIKRAEQYHPIIPIGAGNEVELVFNDGFQPKTLAELARDKALEKNGKDYADRLKDGASDVVYQTRAEAQNAAEMAKYKLGDTLTKEDFREVIKHLPSDN
ncbi:TrbI/VirB10 family protein [Klebsiella sp. PL-2018]|uniref:TrbI/VirB10 family protein n=1 Tax=Klebsiella sp. PL-2018 TaxID=2851540 RepID=UPI001C76C824|nr:TrbI/VirB10 family protein [Klebsiella sp. PL-2018]QXD01283.1 IncF plasmid conjugative transfer pilus assembly protein TraB [Klebsiella sp. PL-2018]